MIGNKCPVLERNESSVINDKDIDFINNKHKREFEFWCCEKDD